MLASICASPTWAQTTSTTPLEEAPTRYPTIFATFDDGAGENEHHCEVLSEYADGSRLLQTKDGRLWTLRGSEIKDTRPSDEALQPASKDEIFSQLKDEAVRSGGFDVYKTRHYVVVYNTSAVYAKWVGNLFENLHKRFSNYWRSKGLKLDEPRFPLVAIVFRDKASYLRFAQADIGDSAKAMIGYYNMKTNQMVSYDLTGVNGLVSGGRVRSTAMIEHVLSRPGAERTVATIVHEAVHQLSFNSGLQTRLAENPYWVSEGMAMFFEAPDPNNRIGWGAIGKINYHNLRLFRQSLRSREEDRLRLMLIDDDKFKKAQTAAQYYPESWALTYFLMKTRAKDYVAYVKELSKLEPLDATSPRDRLELFKEHFGELEELEPKFLRYITRLR